MPGRKCMVIANRRLKRNELLWTNHFVSGSFRLGKNAIVCVCLWLCGELDGKMSHSHSIYGTEKSRLYSFESLRYAMASCNRENTVPSAICARFYLQHEWLAVKYKRYKNRIYYTQHPQTHYITTTTTYNCVISNTTTFLA